MALPIQIPEPCHQDWSGMQAQSNGRFCGSCEKIVVDFSDWEPEQILDYLKTNTKTCGRFKITQLEQKVSPTQDFTWLQSIYKSSLSALGRIAAVVVLLFYLASCGDGSTSASETPNIPTIVDTVSKDDTSVLQGEPVMGDTIIHTDDILGKVVQPETPKPKAPAPLPESYFVKGDIPAPPDLIDKPKEPGCKEPLDGDLAQTNDDKKIDKPKEPMIMGGPMLQYNKLKEKNNE